MPTAIEMTTDRGRYTYRRIYKITWDANDGKYFAMPHTLRHEIDMVSITAILRPGVGNTDLELDGNYDPPWDEEFVYLAKQSETLAGDGYVLVFKDHSVMK